jgi:hypothetical protein
MVKFQKTIFLSLLFFSFFALAGSARAMEKTLYVDIVGVYGVCSDSRSYIEAQNQATPFCSIQKAADVVEAGDTVIVADGTYIDMTVNNSKDVVAMNRGGTAAKWVTFKAENKLKAVIDGQNCWWCTGFVLNNGASYIKLEGFEIKNFIGDGVTIYEGAKHIVIKGNSIHDIAWNTVIPCGLGFDNNGTWVPLQLMGKSCIYVGTSIDEVKDITIDANLLYKCSRKPNVPMCPVNPPPYDDPLNEYRLDHALYINGHDYKITNNIIYDVNMGPAMSPSWGATDIIYANNLIYGGNNYSGYHSGYNIWGSSKNHTIVNNIFVNQTGNAAVYDLAAERKREGVNSPGEFCENCIIKNNLNFSAAPFTNYDPNLNSQPNIYKYEFDSNYQGQDPRFLNASSHDFHLIGNSPAIGTGIFITGVTPAYDFAGNPRPQGTGIDIGPYQTSITDTTPPGAPSGLSVQ